MNLVDTHAHLDAEQLTPQVEAVVARARAAGIRTIITIGTSASSSEQAVALADRLDGIYAAVGIQPNELDTRSIDEWPRIVELARADRVCAIGETGLDAYWDFAPMEYQLAMFDRHLWLALETELPIVIHMRDCGDLMLSVLRVAAERGPLCGVMHSFTGDAGLAERCLELGLHISFAGMVTFKSATDLRETASRIPADRLLLETDSPYLTPHPHRGRRPNEPAMLVHTACCLAEVRDVSVEQLARQTTDNAMRLFGLSGPAEAR